MKTLTLKIQNPCNQNWDKMEQRSIGKHCNSCNKTVVDFTNFTDNQLIRFFQKSKENVCGRIEPDRLNTPLIMPSLPKMNRLKWLFPLTAILSFLGITKSKAQDTIHSSNPINLQDTVIQATLKQPYQPNKIKQPFIEIMVLDKEGKPLSNNLFLKIRARNFRSLNYSFKDGLFLIPTDQITKDEEIRITISDYLYEENFYVSQYSYLRYEVKLQTLSGANQLESIPRRGFVMGCISLMSTTQSHDNFNTIFLDYNLNQIQEEFSPFKIRVD